MNDLDKITKLLTYFTEQEKLHDGYDDEIMSALTSMRGILEDSVFPETKLTKLNEYLQQLASELMQSFLSGSSVYSEMYTNLINRTSAILNDADES